MEGRRVLQQLVTDGRLDSREAERWALEAQRVNENPLDLIIDANVLEEADVLKAAANLHRTQFVGTEKLVKAPIERSLLEMVPVRIVERFKALPILLDRKTQTMSVVVADLEQLDVDKQIAIVSKVRQVKCYVARPRTVRALIRRWYYGDTKLLHALVESMRVSLATKSASIALDAPSSRMDDYGMDDEPPPTYERNPPRPQPASIGIDLPGFRTTGAREAIAAQPPAPSSPTQAVEPDDFEDIPGLEDDEPQAPARASAAAVPPPPAVSPAPLVMPTFKLPSILPAGRESFESLAPPPGPRIDPEVAALNLSFLETTSVLVALVEQGRDELRGHSSQVARLVRKVMERIGVSEAQSNAIVIAAQLHDIGKTSAYHLTALNVATYEGHRTQAQKSYLAPTRLFESAKLPKPTIDSLVHLYERFDGTGFPDRLTGREIPLGARVLAAVESYLDLTTTTRNPFRKQLSASEGCEALAASKGTVFDPTIIDLVRLLVLGDDLDRRLDATRRRVLLVDPDPEETTVLEMRLVEHGYDTVVARDAEAALAKIAERPFDLLVTEVELPGDDGFRFLTRVRGSGQPDLPVLVLTRRSDRESVDRGFALGAVDFLVKPASADVVAAKIRLALEAARPALAAPSPVRGVTGQLSEMSLPDVVQIFGNGRRTGRMTIKSGGRAGEIHFRDGWVYDAKFGGLETAEAVYAMLALTEGEFSLDSSFVPEVNRINASSESLLLEGMRRLDELAR